MLISPMEHAEPPSSLLPPGKDEMNFAEFPIALLTDRAPRGQKSIKFEDQIYDERRKKLITRKRVIEGSEEYGLPTATDDTVVLALIQLTKLKTNFSRRDIDFSRLELIRMLGWPNEGKSYDRIKLSLQRIANVTYNYDNAWWDPRQKTWTTKIFHIIDTVEINDSRASNGQGGLFPSRIVWNEVVFDSFQAGFLRNINFQLCIRLEHPTALRMYRFLGKRFHHKADWTFDLKEFAYEHIGLGRNYEGGTQIARKLQPAIAELETVGFLEVLDEDARFLKKGREWQIRLIQKAPAPTAALPTPATPDGSVQEPPGLVTELIKREVTRAVAVELAQKHPAEFIQLKMDVFDWLMEKQDKRVAKSPAGYLVKSIEDDYAAPKGFESKADRQKREEARKAREQQAADARRQQREQEAREQAERKAVADYWQSLSPEEQAELDATATAAADPETLAMEHGPLRRIGQQLRRHEHIRHLLKNRDSMLVEA
jgi:Replication initiator protein A